MCTFPPPVIPTCVIVASPGPLTTHPIIDTVMGTLISSKEDSSFLTVSITGNCCLAHDGQEIIFTPLFLIPKPFNIS